MPVTTIGEALRTVRKKKTKQTLTDIGNMIGAAVDTNRLGYAGAQHANWDKPSTSVDLLTESRLKLLQMLYDKDVSNQLSRATTAREAKAAAGDLLKTYLTYMASQASSRGQVSQEKIKAVSALSNNIMTALNAGNSRGSIYDINTSTDDKLREDIINNNPDETDAELGFPKIIGQLYQSAPGTGKVASALEFYIENHPGYKSVDDLLDKWDADTKGANGQTTTEMKSLIKAYTEDMTKRSTTSDKIEPISLETRANLQRDMSRLGSYNTAEEKATGEKILQAYLEVYGLDDATKLDEAKKKALSGATEQAEGTMSGMGTSLFDKNPQEFAAIIRDLASGTTINTGDYSAKELKDTILNSSEWQTAAKDLGLDTLESQEEILQKAIQEAVKHGHYSDAIADLSFKQSAAKRSGDTEAVDRLGERIDGLKEKDKKFEIYSREINIPNRNEPNQSHYSHPNTPNTSSATETTSEAPPPGPTTGASTPATTPEAESTTPESGIDNMIRPSTLATPTTPIVAPATDTVGQPGEEALSETKAQKFKRQFGEFSDKLDKDLNGGGEGDDGLSPITVTDPNIAAAREAGASRRAAIMRRLGIGPTLPAR